MTGSMQQYCVSWNNHRSSMLLGFENLFHTESFTDVTLACDDGVPIKCHKVVLAACSSYLRKLLIENDCRHPIVILSNIKYSEITAILEYMYKGQVIVAQDQLAGLLKAAETLRVKGLVEDNLNLSVSESPTSRRPLLQQIPSVSSVFEVPTANSPSNLTPNFCGSSNFPTASDSNCEPTSSSNRGRKSTTEPVPPMTKKKFKGTDKGVIILKTGLDHTSQTPPLHQQESRKSSARQPNDHNQKVRNESQEQYKDDFIDRVENGKRHDDDYPNVKDTEDKHGSVQKLECKRYKQYSSSDLLSAIEDVKQGMSALATARKFHVPSRTLYDRLKRLGIVGADAQHRHPSRKGNFLMPPCPGLSLNLRTDKADNYSSQEQLSDLPGNITGTSTFTDSGSDREKLDFEPTQL